jgi:hypothetical protein
VTRAEVHVNGPAGGDDDTEEMNKAKVATKTMSRVNMMFLLMKNKKK